MNVDQHNEQSPGQGRAPFFVGVALAAVLLPLTAVGALGAISTVTTPRAVAAAPASEAPAVTETGSEAPVSDAPDTTPDRGSDHTEEVVPEDVKYLIQPGDTLTSISAELGVSVDAIAGYNAVRDINVISSGAVLRVPFLYVPPTEG